MKQDGEHDKLKDTETADSGKKKRWLQLLFVAIHNNS